MANTKESRQIIVDFIITCLENGEQRNAILAKAVNKWQMSARTFDRILVVANKQHTEKQQNIKSKLTELDIQLATDARKAAVMTATERKELLTAIAKGTLLVPKTAIIAGKVTKFNTEPDHVERIRALAELNKMEGDYAPSKIAHTNTDGEDIEVMDYSKMSVEDLKMLKSFHDKYAPKS